MTELQELAREEAINIKKYATQEEINLLDENFFNPTSYMDCIYGQLTGHCESTRALDLIRNCAKKVYIDSITSVTTDRSKYTLNGSPRDLKVKAKDRCDKYISPIEMLIFDNLKGIQYGERIIAFLKSKTNKLIFD